MPSAHNNRKRGGLNVPGKRRLFVHNNRAQRSQRHKSLWPTLSKFLIPIIILVCLFAFVKLSTKEWNNKDKVGFVYRRIDGNVGITIMDPQVPEMTTMLVPGDTEVEVASGYGTLRLKNVWQLGFNEKRGGALLSQTITKNFLFPLHLWSDSDGTALTDSNFSTLVKFVFLPVKTNIAFGDRLMMSLFALKIKNIERNEIDLAKSQFLQREILSDGTPGYATSGMLSGRLTAYFSDNELSEKNLKVSIIDQTGAFGVAQKVGEIVEVLGGKVVSVDKNASPQDIICEVSSSDKTVAVKISKVFGCTNKQSKGNFDVEIKLGSNFVKYF